MTNELAVQNIVPSVEITLGEAKLNNKDEIAQVLERSKKYIGLVITTEDDVKFVYRTRTQMNNLIKALDRKRIDIKNEMYEPIAAIEKEIAELISIVRETHGDLDETYKAYEQKLKDDKQLEIDDIIATLSEGYEIEHNPKWLNKTYKLEEITTDILVSVKEQKREEEKYEQSKATIIQTAEANNLTSDGYIQLLDSGASEVLDIITSINKAGEVKRTEDERKLIEKEEQDAYNAEIERIRASEEKAPVELPPTNEEVIDEAVHGVNERFDEQPQIMVMPDETGELLTRIICVTATRSQLKMMNTYCESIGVRIEKA